MHYFKLQKLEFKQLIDDMAIGLFIFFFFFEIKDINLLI